MSLIDKKDCTLELNKVLDYMENVLCVEFPTNTITLEYLILAILDNKNCHANMILDNCLMSDNMEELKKIYVSALEKVVTMQAPNGKPQYHEEMINAIKSSVVESKKLGSNLVGTEHILLSVLNKENKFSMSKVFDKFMLEYSFVFDKCLVKTKEPKSKSTTKKNTTKKTPTSKKGIMQVPLKSQINTKMITTTSSTEFIDKYTTNLNSLAINGKIDELIGRENEVNEIVKVLSRRKKNNAVLVGKGGCGKTAIVYGIANMIVNGKAPEVLNGKEIVMLNPMAIVSGTHFRGMFEERVNGLFNELKGKNGKYILFIDDIHTVLKNSSKDRDNDISGMIGEILSEGELKVIGTTTFKDYRNSIENNQSLCRKLQKIIIDPTTKEETVKILLANKKYYEEYHDVVYTDAAIEKTVELAERYITDRALPDSAFDVIDLAGANTSLINRDPIEIQHIKNRINEIENEKDTALNNGDFEKIDSLNAEENVLKADVANYMRCENKDIETIEITENDIANIVSEMTKIPVSKLSLSERNKIAHIDEILKKSIVGQDEAINSVCKIIKRNKVGLGDKTKTMANILMLGPTGTGKTLLAKKLAEEIFGDEKALVRIDMSEYSEKNSVSKLTGASPGYVGYENGGQLTEAIKHKQHCVLLLDEIEKADQEVYNIFLQLFDEGRLTDSSGQVVNFKNVIVLMTSNIGAKKASELGNGVGFITNEDKNKKTIIEKELKRKFTPEFINRIDQIVYFNSLSDTNLKNIVKLEINKFNNRLSNIKYNIEYTNDVVNYIHAEAIKKKELGARPIIRLIQDNIEDKVTELMLEQEYEPNYVFHATCENNEIVIY